MTDITVACNGARLTGRLEELIAGKPMAGPVKGDRQKLRLTILVEGEHAAEQVTALKQAAGMDAGPMTNRAALICALGLVSAEKRHHEADALAYQCGCEESKPGSDRYEELTAVESRLREMLVDTD